MSAAIDPSAKLERALRFADLAINAAAVPLPTVAPAVEPQDISRDAAVGDTADGVDIELAAQSQPAIAQQPNRAHIEQPASIEQLLPDDAVARSLQSALDAVRDSLHETSSLTSVDLPQDVNDLPGTDAAPAGQIASATNFVHPIAPLAASMSVGVAAGGGISTSDDGVANDVLSAIPQPVDVALAQPDLLQNVMLAQPGVLHDVAYVVQSVEATVEDVTGTLSSTLNGLLGGGSADAGAVTIPSLGGLGLDALAGLLPVAPVVQDLSHTLDSALTSLQDMPVFAAIGAPEVVHADQELAHATHSVLHLVGSGLI